MTKGVPNDIRDRPASDRPVAVAFLPAANALSGALLDSRQRWRDLVTLAADLAFETDADGRFVFLAPDPALGWPVGTLLGQGAEQLLLEEVGPGGFNPFRPTLVTRRRRIWLKRPDGSTACVSLSAAPLIDATGEFVGARGIGHDVSEAERREAEAASVLRRGQVIDHILNRMRTEVMAPRMMQAVLEPLVQATGSEAVAVVDVVGDGIQPTLLHGYGEVTPAALAAAGTALAVAGESAGGVEASDGRRLLACGVQTRFGEQVGLLLFRAPGARAWDADDHALALAGSVLVRSILEHDAIQREMARQARTDPLTGLFNRRAFMDELARHIDRLERDGLPGALLFIDLDHFKELNDACGHDAGDEALRITAHLLRNFSRPTDLVARLGGDEFAVWLNGADEFAAAERAEYLRLTGAEVLSPLTEGRSAPITFSIGVAGRWAGQGEDVEALLHRADQAMYSVKRSGRGHWRVAHRGDDI